MRRTFSCSSSWATCRGGRVARTGSSSCWRRFLPAAETAAAPQVVPPDRGRKTRRRTSTIISVYLSSFLLFSLTSCQTLRHQFIQPAPDWQSKVGQLQYRGPKTSLIGDVLVRYSSRGDFELTFSKGPGVTLLIVRQDDKFVRVSGPLARGSWSGPPNETPVRLRGWVSLRELLLRSKSEAMVRQTVGSDSFTFAF